MGLLVLRIKGVLGYYRQGGISEISPFQELLAIQWSTYFLVSFLQCLKNALGSWTRLNDRKTQVWLLTCIVKYEGEGEEESKKSDGL